MRSGVSMLAVSAMAWPVLACPPSAPELLGARAQSDAQQQELAKDTIGANEARAKLWAYCSDHAANDCIAQCDANTHYAYQEGQMHYKYSAQERADAQRTIDALNQKWIKQ